MYLRTAVISEAATRGKDLHCGAQKKAAPKGGSRYITPCGVRLCTSSICGRFGSGRRGCTQFSQRHGVVRRHGGLRRCRVDTTELACSRHALRGLCFYRAPRDRSALSRHRLAHRGKLTSSRLQGGCHGRARQEQRGNNASDGCIELAHDLLPISSPAGCVAGVALCPWSPAVHRDR